METVQTLKGWSCQVWKSVVHRWGQVIDIVNSQSTDVNGWDLNPYMPGVSEAQVKTVLNRSFLPLLPECSSQMSIMHLDFPPYLIYILLFPSCSVSLVIFLLLSGETAG